MMADRRKPPPPPPKKRASAPAAPPKLQVVLIACEPTPEPAFPTVEVIPTAEDAAAAKVEAEVAATKQINFKCAPTSNRLPRAAPLALPSASYSLLYCFAGT